MLLASSFEFVPDIFDTPQPRVYKTKEAIVDYAKQRPLWHLRHHSFSRYPLEIHRIDGGFYEGKYSVLQRSGGPTIDLSWSGVSEVGGKQFVGSGSISHYPTFWNPHTSENERAPEAQRDLYRKITKWIKAHCVSSENPISQRTGKPWPPVGIGKEAAKAWANGLHLGPPSNESRRPKGMSRPINENEQRERPVRSSRRRTRGLPD